MKYLKLFENFDVLEEPVVLSDKTIDDVLRDDFFDDVDEEDEDEGYYIDKFGIYHIKNWNVY